MMRGGKFLGLGDISEHLDIGHDLLPLGHQRAQRGHQTYLLALSLIDTLEEQRICPGSRSCLVEVVSF